MTRQRETGGFGNSYEVGIIGKRKRMVGDELGQVGRGQTTQGPQMFFLILYSTH